MRATIVPKVASRLFYMVAARAFLSVFSEQVR